MNRLARFVRGLGGLLRKRILAQHVYGLHEFPDAQNAKVIRPILHESQTVPPTVRPSILRVGCPTPTGTLWPSLPQVPTPGSSAMSLPIMATRVNASGPLPISVAPFT